jgi:predicted murein hydrolase (TIGR00659 family)
MNEVLLQSAYFSIALSLGAYWVGVLLQRRFKNPIFNPLLIATILIIAILLVLGIDHDTYASGIRYLTWFLTPSTVCLAIPLYRQLHLLRRNWVAITVSIAAGCIACAVSVVLMSWLFGLSPELYHSLQAKSVTTAIALGITEQLGGIAGVTSMAVIFTGLFGAVVAESFCRLLRITHPVAKGLAMGNSAHAVGTARALEIGEVEGAMSSLSIVVAGIMTVVIAPLCANLGL